MPFPETAHVIHERKIGNWDNLFTVEWQTTWWCVVERLVSTLR